MRALDVWLYGRRAGRLEQVDGRMRFTYAADYVAAGGAPLSCSLPLGDREHDREAQAFFANLLPEGEARTLVARRLGVSAGNDFGLLHAIGGDCAGAVTLLPPGASPDDLPTRAEVRWLDEPGLAAALDELPRRPLLADPDEGIRLSLAGAQDKLPVVVRDGRIGIPLGRTPSTHIVKTPIVRFDDTVANEALCLELARSLGLPTAAAEVRAAEGREFLLVERYDRRHAADGHVERIHQEDFCQALAIPPQLKYESEGGPGLADCFGVLRASSTELGVDRLALVDAVTLNFLIGNHDAHGKNFSLLLADAGVRLAPLYDLVSTAVYRGPRPQDGDGDRRRVPARLPAPPPRRALRRADPSGRGLVGRRPPPDAAPHRAGPLRRARGDRPHRPAPRPRPRARDDRRTRHTPRA